MSSPKRAKLRTVTVRLFEVDVRDLKKRAAVDVRPWHALLRELVHRVLQLRKPEIH